ncbi:MAG: hypothetical protein WBJ76_03215 [Candidatus Hydrothermia bacterium]|nr:hypothetical protein [Candidatus Hydrothermia bacterium]MDD5572294.1 hypothetical protein [Candidatus Hydrothermia bacterium]
MKKFFECRSCGYIVVSETTPLFCPMCRMSMREVPEVKGKFKSIVCTACGNEFSFRQDYPPYKCAYCNNTFKVSPFRAQEEKL